MMQYHLGQAEKKNWIIAEDSFDIAHQGKCEAIFCMGNGYLGQRAAFEERYVGQTRDMLVNGTFNKFDADEATELPNLPDVTNMEFTLNGARFAMDCGKTTDYLRAMDLETASVCRTLNWESPAGQRYALRFSRFASADHVHIVAQKVEITPLDADASVCVESGIDGRMTNEGSQHFHQGDMRVFGNRILRMVSKTTQSGVTCCLHTAHSYRIDGHDAETRLLPRIERRRLAIKATMTVPKGKTLVIEKLTAVTTSRDLCYDGMENAGELAAGDGRRIIEDAEKAGYDGLFAASAAKWAQFWAENDVRIVSQNDFDQLLLRFALYHLNVMVNKDDSRMGIGAKGLTGEGYKGHSFWDTEIFLLPYFTLTQPETARKLVEYRYKGLYGARLKARENGYEGAMYPWEAAWIDDGEVTPLEGGADVVTGEPIKYLTGLIEQHITADVAFGVWQYYMVTGDQEWMDRCGYEMIIDTARFWASRCEWDEDKGAYVIRDVIGPDEYKEHVDNNAYTNYMAGYNLDLGVRVMEELQRRGGEVYERLNRQFDFAACKEKMARVSAKLYRPQPDENGIVPQFEGYSNLRHIDLAPYKASSVVGTIYNDYNPEQISGLQVHKQADTLVLMLLMDDLFPQEIKTRNYYFYEERTLHDSSLSKSTHCVLAADLHEDETAYRFFEGCRQIDLGPIMTTSDAGVHSASMGGVWQCAVYGFGGLRVVGDELHVNPRLPKAWHALQFPVIWRGQRLRVQAEPKTVTVENLGSETVNITLAGKATAIEAGKRVSLPL